MGSGMGAIPFAEIACRLGWAFGREALTVKLHGWSKMSFGSSSVTYATSLKGRYVFLSASFPEPGRSPTYYLDANRLELRAAVLAAVTAIFGSSGRLVFG